MTKEEMKKEIENRNLKHQNNQLMNANTILNRQYKNLNEHFERRVNEKVKVQLKPIEKEVTELKRQVAIKEDIEQRLTKKLEKQEIESRKIINEKDAEIYALKKKLIEQAKELDLTKEERDKYLAKLNLDGTTAGIPTSMTPINKKKIIPNTREKTEKSIGGQVGHKKQKLEKFKDEEINETEEITLKECPNCHSRNLQELDSTITKDELDYEIKIIKKRYYFKEYKCDNCKKIVRQNIPNRLKEENQYGKKVQANALSLTNIANVPFNKIKRILSGLSMEEIEPCEGYLAKIQKQASKNLESFNEELRQALLTSEIIYWDDTVIQINKNQSCMRYYGNDLLCLFKAHEKKNKAGLDEDRILSLLSSNQVVEHDHNKVNYNKEYSFINAECCQHLLRDLKKVEQNIPNRTWCKEIIKLFQEFDHKRKDLINKGIDKFTNDEINDFILKLDTYLLRCLEENEKNPKPYYAEKEKILIYRIMEYRDNYIYWILDFDIPFTNNLSERNLRGIKSKMKVSGQFQNIDRARDYAKLRSYIETCRLYGINEYDCLTRLVEFNPYTFAELQALKNK